MGAFEREQLQRAVERCLELDVFGSGLVGYRIGWRSENAQPALLVAVDMQHAAVRGVACHQTCKSRRLGGERYLDPALVHASIGQAQVDYSAHLFSHHHHGGCRRRLCKGCRDAKRGPAYLLESLVGRPGEPPQYLQLGDGTLGQHRNRQCRIDAQRRGDDGAVQHHQPFVQGRDRARIGIKYPPEVVGDAAANIVRHGAAAQRMHRQQGAALAAEDILELVRQGAPHRVVDDPAAQLGLRQGIFELGVVLLQTRVVAQRRPVHGQQSVSVSILICVAGCLASAGHAQLSLGVVTAYQRQCQRVPDRNCVYRRVVRARQSVMAPEIAVNQPQQQVGAGHGLLEQPAQRTRYRQVLNHHIGGRITRAQIDHGGDGRSHPAPAGPDVFIGDRVHLRGQVVRHHDHVAVGGELAPQLGRKTQGVAA